MLDHGADPNLQNRCDGRSAVSIAARRGRGDALALFERRGFSPALAGIERVLAACARNDTESIRTIAERQPDVVAGFIAEGGTPLAEFAGNGNTEGVVHILDLGVEPGAVCEEGDGYFGTAKKSTALHVAAWRARHAVVKLLIDRGAPFDLPDGEGRTPLALAVRACVDSYWTSRRSPESVKALLAAGASVAGVRFPSGYAEVDELLAKRCAEPFPAGPTNRAADD
jgi:ankyrin repeat protein